MLDGSSTIWSFGQEHMHGKRRTATHHGWYSRDTSECDLSRNAQPPTAMLPASSMGCTMLSENRDAMPPPLVPVKAVRCVEAQERKGFPIESRTIPRVSTPLLLHCWDVTFQKRHVGSWVVAAMDSEVNESQRAPPST